MILNLNRRSQLTGFKDDLTLLILLRIRVHRAMNERNYPKLNDNEGISVSSVTLQRILIIITQDGIAASRRRTKGGRATMAPNVGPPGLR